MAEPSITYHDFSKIYLDNRAKFCTIARSYVRDAALAEDIVDESFMSFWDNRDHITLAEIPQAYILRTVKNKCLNHLRDQSNRLRILKDWHDDSLRMMNTEIDILKNDNIGQLFKNEVQGIFSKQMAESPELTRQIFLSSRFDEKTYDEIAEKYNISSRKVKREIQKSLSKLRIALQDYI